VGISRHLVILLACAVPGSSFGQDARSELYQQLERLYSEVITAYLGDGGLCLGRRSAVEQKQRELANALSEATAVTGDRVLLFAVTANSLADVIRLNELGASRTGDNGSLLHVAVRFADPAMLEYLISVGLGIEDPGWRWWSRLARRR
jgi:hypothetical protein